MRVKYEWADKRRTTEWQQWTRVVVVSHHFVWLLWFLMYETVGEHARTPTHPGLPDSLSSHYYTAKSNYVPENIYYIILYKWNKWTVKHVYNTHTRASHMLGGHSHIFRSSLQYKNVKSKQNSIIRHACLYPKIKNIEKCNFPFPLKKN